MTEKNNIKQNHSHSNPAKKILFTGGGSAGHVTPNIALIKHFQQRAWQVEYIGSHNGLEKDLINDLKIPYHAVNTGKLRRYFSWQTFLMPLQVLSGMWQAYQICRRSKAHVMFSKGGFVAVPAVIGAWLNRIPVICHESDLTPGLANRLCFPFCKKVCVTLPEGKKYFSKQDKVIVTGTPIRTELLQGDKVKGLSLCGFNSNKPVLLILGGGQGAMAINNKVRSILDKLLAQFQIVNLCGKGKVDASLNDVAGYKQFDYVTDEMADLLACSDIVISRAGATAIYELLRLQKPSLLIPMPLNASRGDQIHNAKYFNDLGLCKVLEQKNMDEATLLANINELYESRQQLQQAIADYILPDSVTMIYDTLQQSAAAKATVVINA